MTPTPIASSDSEPDAPVPAADRRRRLRLEHRIVIAVILVALVSTGGATWFAVRVTTTAFRARLQAQLVGSASAVATVGLALNPGILRTLSGIVGAQIVTLGPEGTVLASSTETADPQMIAAVQRVASARGGRVPVAETTDCGFPCMVAVGEVEGRPGAIVGLVAGLSELDAITRSVANAIVVAGLLSVVVLVVVTQIAVRRLIVPLERLVTFVRELAPGDNSQRAAIGSDEVGELSEAFNAMLDRLEHSRAAELRSGKLGLAGLFAARVAHDIRNPLSSIKLQTQLLHAQATDADVKTTLTGIVRDINQVESVVSDLMELARPGDLRREPVPLNDVVREALQQVAAQFAYRKIEVEVRLEDGLPLVALDRGRFKQALLNVLVNGAEALHTGGRMSVATARAESSVSVEICDDGVGIPNDIRERVFEPFVSSKPDGVGLGLVNVRSVVEGHGGRITLEARHPRGTCARIRIPVTMHG